MALAWGTNRNLINVSYGRTLPLAYKISGPAFPLADVQNQEIRRDPHDRP